MLKLSEKQFIYLNSVYNKALAPLWEQLKNAANNPEATFITEALISKAKQYNLDEACRMINANPQRNLDSPNFYEDPHILYQPWADNIEQPLESGESWNKGRRATNIHMPYSIDCKNLPINPYLNFGLVGRGGLGRYGPNHAVDCGVLRVMPNAYGANTLHILGIIRGDDGKKALCGGYTTFEQSLKGDYPYTKNDITRSQVHEFFEELVSGSVELLPQYAQNLNNMIADKTASREMTENKELSDKQRITIARQIETELKVKQAEAQDPAFLNTIQNAFNNATPCFAGPVLSSTRNTNHAWMETYLSWIELDNDTWQTWQKNSPFNYDFKAGDDAQDVLWHEITPELIKDATPSHGAFFSFLLASYMTKQASQGLTLPHSIKAQALNVIHVLNPQPLLA